MKGQQTLFASARTEESRAEGSTDSWGTPQRFYDLLDEEFKFTLDPCADEENAKCTYFDEADDGLAQDWGRNTCFVNFPYSQARAWAEKCVGAANAGATVVVLCASRTETEWWQLLASAASEVRFYKGRLRFVAGEALLRTLTEKAMKTAKWKGVDYEVVEASVASQSAGFPSCVFVIESRKSKLAPPRNACVMKLIDLSPEDRR